MTNKLKPCPFCGGEVATISGCKELEECKYFEDCEEEEYVCVVCDYGNGGCGASGGYRTTEQEAIAAWNRRPPARALTLDELRGMEGKPVWVVWLGEFGDTPSGWAIVSRGCPIPAGGSDFRYGETWVAYDCEPEDTP